MNLVDPPEPPQTAPNLAPPPGHPRFHFVDVLRGLAVLSIIIFHSRGSFGDGGWWIPYWDNLAWGVGVFFVISGFLLYRPFSAASAGQARGVRARDFYRRRALRIVPGYWLALTILGLAGWAAGLFGPDTWRYYGLVQALSDRTFKGGLIVTWSLSIECILYLLLPLYVWATHQIKRAAGGTSWHVDLACVLAVCVGLVLAITVSSGRVPSSIDAVMTSTVMFLFGMILAVLSVGRTAGASTIEAGFALVRQHPAVCWASGVVLFFAAGAGLGKGDRLSYLLEAATAVLIVLPAVAGPLRRGAVSRVLRTPVLAWLGLISYGLYLWHEQLIFHLRGAGHHEATSAAVAHTVLAWGLTLACATASYYLWEAPIMRAGGTRRGRRIRAAKKQPAGQGRGRSLN